MERARVNGVELEYEVVGSGEPILLIDPVLPDGVLPLVSAPALADRYQLIRYHKRGWIGSTHTLSPVTIVYPLMKPSRSSRSIRTRTAFRERFTFADNSAWEIRAFAFNSTSICSSVRSRRYFIKPQPRRLSENVGRYRPIGRHGDLR